MPHLSLFIWSFNWALMMFWSKPDLTERTCKKNKWQNFLHGSRKRLRNLKLIENCVMSFELAKHTCIDTNYHKHICCVSISKINVQMMIVSLCYEPSMDRTPYYGSNSLNLLRKVHDARMLGLSSIRAWKYGGTSVIYIGARSPLWTSCSTQIIRSQLSLQPTLSSYLDILPFQTSQHCS